VTDWYIINMQDGRMWGDCPMCNQWRKLDHAIAWCCGPTHDEIGSMSSEYFQTEVGGMGVCKECHDRHYQSVTLSGRGGEKEVERG